MAGPSHRNPIRQVQPYRPPTLSASAPITTAPAPTPPAREGQPERKASPAPRIGDGPARPLEAPPSRPRDGKPQEPISPEELSHRLSQAIKAAGLSPADAARGMGWPQARMAELLNGRGNPGFLRLVNVVGTLGLDWRIVLPEASPAREG